MSKLRKFAVVTMLTFAVIATAASGSEEGSGSKSDGGSSATADKKDDGVLKGGGSADASADVSVPTILREGDAGFEAVYAEVTIKNNSSKPSDYFVTVVAESPDGATRIDESMVSVMALAPGQSANEKGIFLKEIPADAVLKVQEVQRTASV